MVFNACFSAEYARVMTRHIDVAIGMRHTVDDRASRAFATGFYCGLGFGQSVQKAFEIGTNQVALEGHRDYPEPLLLTRHGLHASDITLV